MHGNGKSRTELNAVQEKLLADGVGGGRGALGLGRERSFTRRRRCYTKPEPKVTHSLPHWNGNYAGLRDAGVNILATYLSANSPGGLLAGWHWHKQATAGLEIPA